MDYRDADAKLQGRCRERRKLENNTYLERRYTGAIAVRLHRTDVLTFYPDGRIEIDTGGWHTVTTRDRINRCLPRPWSVGSDRGTTVLYKSEAGYHWNPVATVDNSLIILPDGTIKGGGDYVAFKEGIRKADNERNRVRSRARYWIRKAWGIYVDRSSCRASRWNCRTQGWRARRGLQVGNYECGCIVYQKPASADGLTVKSILEEEDVTVRLAKMRIYGVDHFVLDAGARVLDSEAGYELLTLNHGSGNWGREEIRALKMRCPSTGAVYINMLPPYIFKVRNGLDWMFSTENYLERVGQQA